MFDYEYWGHNTLSISDNMAMEELLLKRSEEKKVATIRFWNVDKDAVVLGYGQATSAIKKRDRSFDVARRITGGSHVQFDSNCLAYSFTAPRDGSFKHYDEMRKYFAEYVADAMRELGIDVSKVDNRSSTINVDDKVVASHAMFWGVKSALMHGLMIIEPYNVDRIMERVSLNERKIGKNVYSEYDALRGIPTLAGLLERKTDRVLENRRRDYAKKLLADGILKQVVKNNFKNKELGGKTLADAQALVKQEHTGDIWFKERNPPLTGDRVEAIPGTELDGALRHGLGYCMYIEVQDKDFKKMADPK